MVSSRTTGHRKACDAPQHSGKRNEDGVWCRSRGLNSPTFRLQSRLGLNPSTTYPRHVATVLPLAIYEAKASSLT